MNVLPTGKSLSLNLPEGNISVTTVALAAGRFTGGTHDQLAVAYAAASGTVKIITVDFDSQGNPAQQTTYDTKTGVGSGLNGYGPAVFLQAGRFDWFNQSEQVAFSIFTSDSGNGGSRLEVVSFDANLNPTEGTPFNSSNACHFGLAAGRFDSMQTNPNPPPALQPNPNYQIADLATDCSSGAEDFFNIYDVNPANNFAVTVHSSVFVLAADPQTGPDPTVPTALSISVIAADVQGRSLALSSPEKATITGHIQPDTILGLPPMHVDWITPAGGTVPEILNVSVFPTTFNTAYTFQSSSNSAVSRSGTTSYTYATKESASEKVSYGVPGIASVSLQAKQAATQTHKNTVAKKFNTYSGQSFGFSAATQFDDLVASTSSQYNLYSYRVLGQCVPDAGAPAFEGCGAGTRPLYVQFSGPDNVNYNELAEGRNLEWYQPVQEPGNIFSYPANLLQIEANLPPVAPGSSITSFQPLSPTNDTWDSQTDTAVTASWSQGGGNDVTSGSVSSHSFDASVSASASVSFDGFGAGASAGFDYNSSASTSTTNQSTSSFAASQGITLNRGIGGGPVTSAVYDYQGQSFIYGQLPPTGTVQNDIQQNTAIQAQGFLAVAHVADPVSTGTITSEVFWRQAYTAAPDIALNHPQRWFQKQPSGVNPEQVQFNCPIRFTSSLDSPACSPISQQPTPANVADAVFYQMKGLFVTPGTTTNGPQISSTTLGSKVNLRARIYNYSLANLPAGAIVHAQFYAQPWNGSSGEFASPQGNPNQFSPAVFIGDGTTASGSQLGTIPAFCGGTSGGGDPCLNSSTRNWIFAYATWDTSKNNIAPDSEWKYWVLVWVEVNGKLMTEIPGHGLTSLPSGHFNSLADVAIEPYSNNLGFYNQVFTVLAAPGVGEAKTGRLRLRGIDIASGSSLLRDKPVRLKAMHQTTGRHFDSVITLYYDGDPRKGGTLFDMQSIPRIVAKGNYADTAYYQPRTCGRHEIFVRTIPLDGSAKPATAKTRVDVTINPVVSVNKLNSYVRGLSLPDWLLDELQGQLAIARRAFKRGDTEDGREELKRFGEEVREHKQIPDKAEDAMTDQVKDILGCVRGDRGRDEERAEDGEN